MHRSISLLLVLSALVGVVACDSGPGPSSEGSSESETVTAGAPVVVEGMFDVGGHELYLHCAGSTPPTIVYLHGAITNPNTVPHRNGRVFENRLSAEHRVCVYDRRNVGLSDSVDAVQRPASALGDLRNLLAEAGIDPPYVLLGASFGGALSYLYANEHPDEVVGMVLLDSPFPDEMALEPLWPPEDRYEAYDAEDEDESLERISHFDVLTEAAEYIGREPDIPMTYFASSQEPIDESGIPAFDAQILDVRAAYVDRFSPGELIVADSPHFMEPEIPDQIVAALREVIARGS